MDPGGGAGGSAAASSTASAVEENIVFDGAGSDISNEDAPGFRATLRPRQRRRRQQKPARGLVGVKPQAPLRQTDETGSLLVGRAAHTTRWDSRHHLAGVENELLPRKLRSYFSRPQSLPELRDALREDHSMKAPPRQAFMRSILQRLESEETPQPRTALSTDSGPAVIPDRHEIGGAMQDRNGEVRSWNGRHHAGMQLLNDGLHPLHREYFSKCSPFASAASQRWRRHLDVEVGRGKWAPITELQCRRFPPMGV